MKQRLLYSKSTQWCPRPRPGMAQPSISGGGEELLHQRAAEKQAVKACFHEQKYRRPLYHINIFTVVLGHLWAHYARQVCALRVF